MNNLKSHIKIDRYHRSRIKLGEQGVTFLIDPYNGNYAGGTTISSGTSLARVRGRNFEIDENDNLTSTQLFDVAMSGLVGGGSGVMRATPAFDSKSGRLFVRVATNRGAPHNVVQEIDPLTGAYIGNPLNTASGWFNGGFHSYMEISKDGLIYVDRVNIFAYDLDFNLVQEYTGITGQNATQFGVSPNGNVVAVKGSSNSYARLSDKDDNELFRITSNDVGGGTINDARITDDLLAIDYNNFGDNVIVYDIATQNVVWGPVNLGTITTMSFGHNGDLYVGTDEGQRTYTQRLDITNGQVLWKVLCFDSDGTDPSIGAIHHINEDIIVAHAQTLQGLRFLDADGNTIGTPPAGGSQFGNHPFSNNFITNFVLQ